MRLALALGLLAVAACAAPEALPDENTDAGPVDAGTPTAYPLPLLRMNSARDGTTHTDSWAGVVTEHGPARDQPFTTIEPARRLSVRLATANTRALYYTLPVPFGFRAFPNEQVQITYSESVATAGASSYGAKVTTHDGALRLLVEDATWGPAFDDEDRLGFSFELDLGQPLEEETQTCGRWVRYPVMVTNGERTRRLFPGEEQRFDTEEGVVRFVLLDAWRLEDSLCGDAPAVSLGYLALPVDE